MVFKIDSDIRSSFENKIFEWEEYDGGEEAEFIFYDVTLVIDVGRYKKGHRFSFARVNYDESILEFYLRPGQDEPSVVFDVSPVLTEIDIQ